MWFLLLLLFSVPIPSPKDFVPLPEAMDQKTISTEIQTYQISYYLPEGR